MCGPSFVLAHGPGLQCHELLGVLGLVYFKVGVAALSYTSLCRCSCCCKYRCGRIALSAATNSPMFVLSMLFSLGSGVSLRMHADM